MDIKFHEIKNVFDTLPIGYYLGRRIKCSLSDTCPMSYYDCAADEIVISAPMIINAFKKSHPLINTSDLEEVIRGLLYHEVSHVILTCGKETSEYIKDYCRHDIFNIVEDERIETILKDFYMNTNFRKNVYILTNYTGEAPKSDLEKFYHLVRYHEGPEEWVTRLTNLLNEYKTLHAASGHYPWKYYAQAINEFYKDFIRDMRKREEEERRKAEEERRKEEEKKKSEAGSGAGSDDESDKPDQSTSTKSTSSTSDSDDGSDSKVSGTITNNSEDDMNGESSNGGTPMSASASSKEKATTSKPTTSKEGYNPDYKADEPADYRECTDLDLGSKATRDDLVKTAINSFINKYEDDGLHKKFDQIISMSQKKKGMFLGAKMGYSGKINPKACGREDCQWWKKENSNGSLNGVAPIHWTFFIDNSGSFRHNDVKVNTIIRALNKIKSPMFDFDIVTINTEVDEWENTTTKEFSSTGGNCLNSNMHGIFKKHQKRGCNNFNIVLFDGDAHSDDYGCEAKGPNGKDNFSAFDTDNTIIISDIANKKYIDNSVSKARVKITGDYTGELINCIITMMGQMM